MDKQKKAYVYAISVVLFWATVASAFKLTLRHMNFLSMLFYSSAISLVILSLMVVVQGKFRILRNYSKKDYIRSLFLGVLNPFVYYLVLFKAYSLLPAQQALPLNLTWAIIIPFISSRVLKQKIQMANIISLLISFFGVVVLATHGNLFSIRFSNPFGVSLALGSAVIWALFWVYNVKDTRDVVVKLFLNFLFGFIFVATSFVVLSELSAPTITGLIGATYIGLFEMGVTYVLWLKAMQLSESTAKVTNLVYLVPFISFAIIGITIGEQILFSTISGLLLILAGIAVSRRS